MSLKFKKKGVKNDYIDKKIYQYDKKGIDKLENICYKVYINNNKRSLHSEKIQNRTQKRRLFTRRRDSLEGDNNSRKNRRSNLKNIVNRWYNYKYDYYPRIKRGVGDGVGSTTTTTK